MKLNGCHNRESLRNVAFVQLGWRYDGDTRTPVMIEIPDPMIKTCIYQKLKKDDPACTNCRELE